LSQEKFSLLYEDFDVIRIFRFLVGVYGLSDKEIKEKSDHLIESTWTER